MKRKKDYKILEEQCLVILKENNILTMDGITPFLPFSLDTFFEYELDRSKVLQNAINDNRAVAKQQLMQQWMKPNASPTCQIALYKLLATEEERRAMSSVKKEDSGNEEISTQEAYLRSLEEMGKDLDDAD